MVLKEDSITVVTFDELDPADQELVIAASEATADAHNPHLRRWSVGAALRLGDGSRVTKANWEHPTPQLTTCAEKRLVDAIDPGLVPSAQAMAVVGRRPRMSHIILSPCDICRPVLRDFARQTASGEEFRIILAPWNFRKGKLLVLTAGDIRELPEYSPEGIDWRTLGD